MGSTSRVPILPCLPHFTTMFCLLCRLLAQHQRQKRWPQVNCITQSHDCVRLNLHSQFLILCHSQCFCFSDQTLADRNIKIFIYQSTQKIRSIDSILSQNHEVHPRLPFFHVYNSFLTVRNMDSFRINTFTYLVNSPEYNHLAQSVQMPSSAHFSLTTRTAPLSMRAPSLLCWSLLTLLGSWFLIPDSPTTPSPAPCPLSRHSALPPTHVLHRPHLAWCYSAPSRWLQD